MSILEELLFRNVFDITTNKDKLGRKLNQDKSWYKVGEKVFAGNEIGLERLKHIKNKVGMVQTEKFFEVFGTSHPGIKWGDFKDIGINDFKINTFINLPFENDSVIAEMDTTKKEKIAEAMVSVDGWEHFVDHYFKDDEERKKDVKLSISNLWQSSENPTKDLVKLIFQQDADYTLKKFFDACRDCGYNETLKDLKNMCSSYKK